MNKLYIVLLFAALGFAEPISKVDIDLDPVTFVKESNKKIQDFCLEFVDYLQDIETYKDAENKDEILKNIYQCSDELEAISIAAKSIKLEKIVDRKLMHAVKQLRKWGGPLKIGDDIIHLGINVKNLKELYSQSALQSFENDDMTYSLKEIEEGTASWDETQELQYYWQASVDLLRDNADDYFFDVVKLIQTKAKKENMTASEFWYPNYNEETMKELNEAMKVLKPLYETVHAYVRQKLYESMGAGVIKPYGPISADIYQRFLLYGGETFADWELVNKVLSTEFDDESDDLYEEITDDKTPSTKWIKAADNIYKSLGFEPLDNEFWDSTSSNYDIGNKRCLGKVSSSPLSTRLNSYCYTLNYYQNSENYVLLSKIHAAKFKKELALYEFDGYYMDEAIGNAAKMSILSPKIVKATIKHELTKEESLKLNLRYAIAAVLSIPNAYVNIKVLTAFLDGKVKKQDLNKYYWNLMEKYAGVEPPIDREDDSLDLPYSVYLDLNENRNIIDKFRANILSYQIYRGTCQFTGHVGPIHTCHFEDKKEVGGIWTEMLSLGSSEPLEDVLARLFKSKTKLDATALLDYFEVASEWFNTYKKKHQKKIKIGWEHTSKLFSKRFFSSEDNAVDFASKSSKKIYELYDQIAADLFNQKFKSEEFVIGYEDTFWKLSNVAVAARELKDISLMAQQYDVGSFENKTLKRAMRKLSQVADVFVLGDEMEQFMKAKEMLANLSTDHSVLKYKAAEEDDTLLAYYPDIVNVFMNSDDDDELIYYWKTWRENNIYTCKVWLKDMLSSFEKAANILGISTSQFWFKNNKLKLDNMEEIISELTPLYKSLHAYLRSNLDLPYMGALPDHIMEKQLLVLWSNKSAVEKDFPFAELVQYDKLVSKQEWDAKKLLHLADDFYKSLGFTPMPDEFWNKQVQPQEDTKDSDTCYANVYDKTPKVYIKYCEKVNAKKFFQAHGYMGRTHYAVEKAELPAYFFDSYFLEYPVGEAVIISATSPKHLKTLGLLEDAEWSEKVALNRLIRVAINSLVKLFRNFVNTKLVFDYLQGEVEEKDITRYYWELMIKHAGIEPSADRTEEDFDFPYEFYTDLEQNHQFQKFISEVMGYGMFEKFCELSGHAGDLNNCDFYGSEKVGEALKKIMQLGSTVSEEQVLKTLVPSTNDLFSSRPILAYFEPLKKWLAVAVEDPLRFDLSTTQFYRSESFIPEEEEEEEEDYDDYSVED